MPGMSQLLVNLPSEGTTYSPLIQDLTETEEKVLELKDQIENITLAMVKAIEKHGSANMPQDLLDDIEELRTCVFLILDCATPDHSLIHHT